MVKHKLKAYDRDVIGPPTLQAGRCPLAATGEAREGGRRRPRCQLTLRHAGEGLGSRPRYPGVGSPAVPGTGEAAT